MITPASVDAFSFFYSFIQSSSDVPNNSSNLSSSSFMSSASTSNEELDDCGFLLFAVVLLSVSGYMSLLEYEAL